MRNIAVFASGNGTNAENIINYFREENNRDIARVALIICNNHDAGVIGRAQRLGVPVGILSRKDINNPEIILPLLEKHGVDFIVLAGFLLLIPGFLISQYPGKIINIHPSLLPDYGGKGMYGHNVHIAVINAKEKFSGITIHYVTAEYDKGEHIAQFRVPILPEDSVEELEAKIHILEQEHFPKVIANLLH